MSPWRKKEPLGINTIRFSSMIKLSIYLYINAYELEYSLVHVKIMIYELAYILCVMFLTCSSLFFIVHLIRMNRGRIRDEVTVHHALVVALNLAYQSVGLRSWGVRSCFLLHERGDRVCGDQRICGYSTGRGVSGHVVTAMSIPCIPPRSGIQ